MRKTIPRADWDKLIEASNKYGGVAPGMMYESLFDWQSSAPVCVIGLAHFAGVILEQYTPDQVINASLFDRLVTASDKYFEHQNVYMQLDFAILDVQTKLEIAEPQKLNPSKRVPVELVFAELGITPED